MAFKKTIQTQIGVEIVDAYHRVEFVTIRKGNKKIDFHLRTYVNGNSDAWISDACFSCNYDINGSNPVEQAYSYIRSDQQFLDAVDC